MDNDPIKNYVGNINNHLENALFNAIHMQKHVFATEGDSDLHRKLAFYLIPSLNHWLTGAQAGSMKDLAEFATRNDAALAIQIQQSAIEGDGHAVLTQS